MPTFQRESEMTGVAVGCDTAWWTGRRSPDFVAAEIVGPDAIADLVAVRFDRAAVARRAACGIRPLPDRLALLAVLACRAGASRTNGVARALRVSPSGARRALAVAAEHGALQRVRGGQVNANPGWSPVVDRAVAVELKLSDWRGGLEQAACYLQWASSSWLIVAAVPSERAREAARGLGVGLATLTPDGALRRWVRPRASRQRASWASAWTGEQALARAEAAAPAGRGSATAVVARSAGAPAALPC